MQKQLKKITLSGVSAAVAATVCISSQAKDISEQPVYDTRFPDPNLILILDDSGSMHAETLTDTNDGRLRWDREGKRFTTPNENKLAFSFDKDFNFSHIYPFGENRVRAVDSYDGRIPERNSGKLPPLNIYGFIRSPHYNKAYFDHTVDYQPWASYGGYDQQFTDVNVLSAPLDPLLRDGSNQVTVNLNTLWSFEIMDSLRLQYGENDTRNWKFTLLEGMPCDDNGTVDFSQCAQGQETDTITSSGDQVNVIYRHYDYNPAFYFRVVTQEDGVFFATGNSERRQCDTAAINTVGFANLYHDYMLDPAAFFPDAADRARYAIGPDGLCLEKVQLTTAAELQNFANWFTYYRRRHHALRAGLGLGFQNSENDFNLEMFTINRRDGEDMASVGKFSENEKTYLENVYEKSVLGGGTPLRTALQQAGSIYQNNTNNIIEHVCQKNYTLLFTDGFNKDGQTGGNSDGQAKAPFQDNATVGSLADLAYEFYHNLKPEGFTSDPGLVPAPAGSNCVALGITGQESDAQLRSKLDDSVEDCNPKLHMTTFTMGLNAKGLIFNNPEFSATAPTSVQDAFALRDSLVWPAANEELSPAQIDDLYHAAVNGRGEILNAGQPNEITVKLRELLRSIGGLEETTQTGIVMNDAKNLIIQGKFSTTALSGDIGAFPIDESGILISGVAAAWSASEKLNARVTSEAGRNSRNIITKADGKGVAFNFDNLSLAQREDINSEQLVDYFRGENTNTDLRIRTSVLGEFANSKIQYVGLPKEVWPDTGAFGVAGNRYSDFKLKMADRLPVVYGGSNDGMLHGFDASVDENGDPGQEVMAYIPESLYANNPGEGLRFFASQEYSRRSYVDLSVTISDVFITTGNNATDWRTVLVGGFRTGGKGLFALDITNPISAADYSLASAEDKERIADETLLWEVNDDAFDTFIGKPQIALLNNQKWGVVVAGGYQNGATKGVDSDDAELEEAEGKLHFISLEAADKSAPDVLTLSTGQNGGLSEPTLLDMDGNGTVDRIYAGDLLGDVWRFDIADTATTNWTVKKVFDGDKAITAPVTARLDDFTPAVNGERAVLLAFGTGKFLSFGDIDDKSAQTAYIVKDTGALAATEDADLASLNVSDANNPGADDVDNSIASAKGFKLELVNEIGQRIFVKPLAFDDEFIFSSTAPNSVICESSGNSFLHRLKIENGSISAGTVETIERPDVTVTDLAVTVGADGTVVLNEVSTKPISVDINGLIQTPLDALEFREGRLSWEELIDE